MRDRWRGAPVAYPNGWSSGRAETTVPEDTSSNDPNAGWRSAPRGRWRDRLESSGSSSPASLVRSRASLIRVADHVRAEMEVMSTGGRPLKPAACAPAGAQQQLRVGPGPILTDRFRGS